jgi:Mg/Co/Ni transporter MgtE
MSALDPVTKNYISLRPEAVAQTLVRLDDASIRAIFEAMSHPLAAKVMGHMAPGSASHCLQLLPHQISAEIVIEMPSLKSVASLRLMKRGYVNELFSLMPKTRVALLRLRLNHAETVIGAFIDSDIITFNPKQHVSDALRLFRRDGQRTGHIIHVLDDRQHVAGSIQLGDLLAASDHTLVKTIMHPAAKVLHARTPLQTMVNHPVWLTHDNLPVTDRNGQFQGVLRRTNVIGEPKQVLNDIDSHNIADTTRTALSDIFWIAIGALFAGSSDSGRNRGENDR